MFFYEVRGLLSFFIMDYCKGPGEYYMQPLNLPGFRDDNAVPVLVLLLKD